MVRDRLTFIGTTSQLKTPAQFDRCELILESRDLTSQSRTTAQ
jgi:hypothetical protein